MEYIVVASKHYIDVFTLSTGEKTPKICHHKNIRMQSKYRICETVAEYNLFYIAVKNLLSHATIDLQSEKKVLLSQQRSQFTEDKTVTATAMRQSMLQGEGLTLEETNLFMAIGYHTADEDQFSISIMKKTVIKYASDED